MWLFSAFYAFIASNLFVHMAHSIFNNIKIIYGLKYNVNRIFIKSLHIIYLIDYHYSFENNKKQDQDTWKRYKLVNIDRFAKYFTTDRSVNNHFGIAEKMILEQSTFHDQLRNLFTLSLVKSNIHEYIMRKLTQIDTQIRAR